MADIFWPFDPALVSEWPGTRPQGWADHVGTDFAVAQGTPLRATVSGTVDIHWSDGLGAWVIDIIAPDGTVVRHGHLSRMDVNDGQWVNAGDGIGLTGGMPGTPGAGLSTGSHLHWEIRNNRGWGPEGWYDPRNLIIKSFPKHAAPSGWQDWEDNMYHFSGASARKTLQKIRENVPTVVTYREVHDPKASDRTICRGPGDMVGVTVQLRLKGTPGARVEMRLVKETGTDVNRVTLSEERRTFDSLGLATATIALSTPLKTGEMVRAVVSGQAGKGSITVERFSWSGYARS